MNWIRRCITSLLEILLTASVIVPAAFADHHEHREKRQHKKGDHEQTEHQGKRSLKTVGNPAYKEHCGACHFAYPTALLPSGSWSKILAALPDHLGESVELDPEAGGSTLFIGPGPGNWESKPCLSGIGHLIVD
jgi:hypothetical protein